MAEDATDRRIMIECFLQSLSEKRFESKYSEKVILVIRLREHTIYVKSQRLVAFKWAGKYDD